MERASEMLRHAVLTLRSLPEYVEIDLYACATYVQSREAIMSIVHHHSKESVDDNCNATADLAMRTLDVIRCTSIHPSLT